MNLNRKKILERYKNIDNWNYMDSTTTYLTQDKTETIVTDITKNMTKSLVEKIKKIPVLYFVINRKKVLLQKIYLNLVQELKNYTEVKVLYIDELKSGTFTNYQMENFIEPQHVMVIYTKYHNTKQSNLLKELSKTKAKPIVITLNRIYQEKNSTIYNIFSIKAFYLFLYALSNHLKPQTYSEFSSKYTFTTQEIDFKNL